jgi:hypothetical protein
VKKYFEHDNELLGFIKGFLDQLSDCKLLKKDPAPWIYFLSNTQALFQMNYDEALSSS